MDNKRKEAIKKAKEMAKYNKEHRLENIIKQMQEMRPFTEDFIAEPPIVDKDTYDNIVIPNFIRCGAIPKDKLVIGKTYIGNCRNAGEAVWLGDEFEYTRHKFGTTYQERINHFQDDDGHDLFVPIKEKEE